MSNRLFSGYHLVVFIYDHSFTETPFFHLKCVTRLRMDGVQWWSLACLMRGPGLYLTTENKSTGPTHGS